MPRNTSDGYMLCLDSKSDVWILPDRRWTQACTKRPYVCPLCWNFLRDRMPPSSELRMYVSQLSVRGDCGGACGHPPFGLYHHRIYEQLAKYTRGEVLYYDCFTTNADCKLRVEVASTGDDAQVYAHGALRLIDFRACVPLQPVVAHLDVVRDVKHCMECRRNMNQEVGGRWRLLRSEVMDRAVVLDWLGHIYVTQAVADALDLSMFKMTRLKRVDVDDEL